MGIKSNAQLRDGSEWAEHEDCLIGDEEGLRSLMLACEVALEKGEYYGDDLGDYVGVKRLSSTWFNGPGQPPTPFANFATATVAAIAVVLMFVGLYTVFTWLP